MIENILEKYRRGEMTLEEARIAIKLFEIESIEGLVAYDAGREFRTGIPEVIFGEGKEILDILSIISRILEKKNSLIVSRLKKEQMHEIEKFCIEKGFFLKKGIGTKTVAIKKSLEEGNKRGKVAILTAGTSDVSVAEEAALVAEELGCETERFYDVGIAGFHRITEPLKKIVSEDVDAIIVCAGMEGALPSVIASFVDKPVIGVPTSVGYGVGKDGVAALHTMLNSCAPGLAVVNIDNGFGAAVLACLIARGRKKG